MLSDEKIYLKPEEAWAGFIKRREELRQCGKIIAESDDDELQVVLSSAGTMAVVRVLDHGVLEYEEYLASEEDMHDELVFIYDKYLGIDADDDEWGSDGETAVDDDLCFEDPVFMEVYDFLSYLVPGFESLGREETTETVKEVLDGIEECLISRGYPIKIA